MPGLSQACFCAEARNYAAKKRPDLQDGRATSAAIGLEGGARKPEARSQELKANSYFPSRASKRKAIAFPKRILAKSWCPGLSRKLLSPGTRTPGTRSTAELPPQTHSSPIDRTCAGGVSALQFLGRSEGLRTLINDWSKSAASNTYFSASPPNRDAPTSPTLPAIATARCRRLPFQDCSSGRRTPARPRR